VQLSGKSPWFAQRTAKQPLLLDELLDPRRLFEPLRRRPSPRELDVLLATGEQVTIALMAMALEAIDCPARSYTGAQVRVRTDSAHNKARITNIDGGRVQADLDAGQVVVVAGFQGIDEHGNITTLGRGGSDTSAVAMAAALKADECQIYTDVDGVYTTDPRIEPKARRLPRITFEEMLEMASLGSKVLQIRAVEFAGKYRVPLRVLSSFAEGEGTLITFEEDDVEEAKIAGIAFAKDEAKLTILGVPDQPGVAHKILGPISDANIEVDMIVQNIAADAKTTDFTFTVHRNDYARALELLQATAQTLSAREVAGGRGLCSAAGLPIPMEAVMKILLVDDEALAREGINIRMISTSEIKISVVIDEKYLELGVRALHDAFDLAHAG